jgi:hypothetical protein
VIEPPYSMHRSTEEECRLLANGPDGRA